MSAAQRLGSLTATPRSSGLSRKAVTLISTAALKDCWPRLPARAGSPGEPVGHIDFMPDHAQSGVAEQIARYGTLEAVVAALAILRPLQQRTPHASCRPHR